MDDIGAHRATPAHLKRWAPDLLKEPVLVWLDRMFLPLQFVLGTALFGLGYVIGGAAIAWSFVTWGVFLRLAYVLHVTWFVNSASHIWGYRNYATRDNSRNLWWVAVLNFGEARHNNHRRLSPRRPQRAQVVGIRLHHTTSSFVVGGFEDGRGTSRRNLEFVQRETPASSKGVTHCPNRGDDTAKPDESSDMGWCDFPAFNREDRKVREETGLFSGRWPFPAGPRTPPPSR